MNRRDFTRGLATFGLTPLLPLPNIATASSGSVAAAATAEKMYFMGWYTARMNKTCSPDFLIRELNVKADVARDIFAKLVETKTISTPNAMGVSRTMEPLADSYRRATGKLARQAISEKRATLKREAVLEPDAPQDDPPLIEEERGEELELVKSTSEFEDGPENGPVDRSEDTEVSDVAETSETSGPLTV